MSVVRQRWFGLAKALVLSAVPPLSACSDGALSPESELVEALEVAQDSELGKRDVSVPEDESETIYGQDRLPAFHIRISEYAEQRLRFEPREYAPALLQLEEADKESEPLEVGLRLKGEGSFRDLDGKSAFKVKVDKYHAEQSLRGLRALTLNNMVQDHSLMAERLAYHVFRELGVPAPRSNHARVYINGVYFGLYANIETPNEDFLARWFEDADRNLYEEGGHDFDHAQGAVSLERETNKKQPEDRERLLALQQACMDNDLARVRELVSWPEFLMYSALEAAVNQVDGYSYAQNGPNNFRIYDAAHGIVFLPWGLDWALGKVATQDGGLFVDPFWVRKSHGVLMRMCLADADCTEEYTEVIERVAARWDALDLEALMEDWVAQVEEAATADDRREVSYEQVQKQQAVRREVIRGRAAALRAALAER